MNTENNIEQRLWEYIDGSASTDELSVVEKLIETNAEWRKHYHELLEIHALMQTSELEAPSMRFTKNVMEEISRLQIAPATKDYINKNIIRGLAIFFVTMIVGLLVYGIGQVNWGTNSNSSIPVDLSSVNFDYNKFFSNSWMNAYIMINIILGLFLFDRYLANKRAKYRNEI